MKDLFDETQIKGMTLKNRIIKSSTWENLAAGDGQVSDKIMDLYRELAEGDIGLILSSCTFVMPGDQFYPGMLGIADDSYIEGHRKLTDMVHSHGSLIASQLAVGGSQGFHRTETRTIWGPSDVKNPLTGITPVSMTKDDISTLVNAFAEGALRAKKAGYDAVQIHGAHGYTVGQFLSPHNNRRTDEYGGSVENRARIFIEIYRAVRDAVGNDFPVLLKINSSDYIENGGGFEECLYVCRVLSEQGIDAVEISGGIAESSQYISMQKISKKENEGYHVESAARIAQEISVPVIVVGGLRSIEKMNEVLEKTSIEYFSMARPFLAEPGLVSRWLNDKRAKSRCVSCNSCQTGKPSGNLCVFKEKFNK